MPLKSIMEITPKKCCVRYDPPTLLLFYEIKSSGKLHRRSIPIRDLDFEETDEDKILNGLLSAPHHSKYIKEFNIEQLKRLVKMLIEKNSGLNIDLRSNNSDNNNNNIYDNGSGSGEDILPAIDIEKTDLNKLGDEELDMVKDKMDETFIKNQLKPGDKGWKYDNEVDFETVAAGAIESSAWDDEDSDMEF